MKLGGRVHEGKWLGVDEESKGVRVYWPDTKKITVERNVYYNNSSACHSEGEQNLEIVETKANVLPANILSMETTPTVVDHSERARCTQKPTQHVLDLLEEHTTWSN